MGSTYPVPTNLVFLAALPSVTEGVKVRFLGCVQRYDHATGALTLAHHVITAEGATAIDHCNGEASPQSSVVDSPSWIYLPKERGRNKPTPAQCHEQVLAVLDTALLTESLTKDPMMVQIGSWLHVTGYVGSTTVGTEVQELNWEGAEISEDEEYLVRKVRVCKVQIQAQLVWEAKGLDLARYERAVKARQDSRTGSTAGSA